MTLHSFILLIIRKYSKKVFFQRGQLIITSEKKALKKNNPNNRATDAHD
jgi:hypothetical protein